MNLVQKSVIGQNVTFGLPMNNGMERELKGDAKNEFLQKTSLAGSRTVDNFTTVLATMTAHVLPTYIICDQRQDSCKVM